MTSHNRARVDVNENENDQKREGDDDFQPFLRSLEILELAGPFDVVAGRILNALAEQLRCFAHVAIDVARGDIDKDKPDKLAVFTADGWRPGFVADVGEQRDRNLRAGWRRHQHAFERVDIVDENRGHNAC